ncbi:autoinducer synthase [Sphingobium sp. Leaf26]|uniref:acyl-homoserine-lactone synthase n=1 Tax=Sphingobium sp. Leaf26 TaxID=1735693 RepID=UPI0006F55C93|nr:acyl-homoserine-lactone synthase [Sphingobium sp. Leaf26]KQM99257.1 autoinducer synthase [Sphingobium sp. Leaf26]
MIHILDHQSSRPRHALVQSMFVDRKALFVDFFGWDIPVLDGRFEMDQFDTDDALYVIVADAEGSHAASLRLLPTERPHMLRTIFPDLCPLGVPEDGCTWESTRLCLPRRHGAARRRALRNQLFSAAVDLALQRGIKRYTGVLPEPFRKELLAMGWRAEPLGPAVRMQGGLVGAFLVHIDPDTPRRLSWTQTYVDADMAVVA